jgi:hypothetical protein
MLIFYLANSTSNTRFILVDITMGIDNIKVRRGIQEEGAAGLAAGRGGGVAEGAEDCGGAAAAAGASV